MKNWHRPYSDPLRPFTGLVVLSGGLVACFVFFGVVVVQVVPMGPGLVVLAFATVWLGLCWRIHRTALLVSESGVRVRWLLRSRTFAWQQVQDLRFAPDALGAERLWIELASGRKVRTPVQRVRRLLGGSLLIDGGTWLQPDSCSELLAYLGHELRERRA